MEFKKTSSGFRYCEFKDSHGTLCCLQKNDKTSIWLGIDEPDPKILESKVSDDKNAAGWVKYPIHEDVFIKTQMWLNTNTIKELISILERFLSTGEILS